MEEDLAKRVRLRSAGPADLERLRRWDEQPHVVASDPNDDWDWETELHEVPENLRALDIWIGEESDTGKGYGTKMMQLALARCFADPRVSAVLVDPLAANTRAHRFYERLGFRFVEARRFGQDDCFVYRLDRLDSR